MIKVQKCSCVGAVLAFGARVKIFGDKAKSHSEYSSQFIQASLAFLPNLTSCGQSDHAKLRVF